MVRAMNGGGADASRLHLSVLGPTGVCSTVMFSSVHHSALSTRSLITGELLQVYVVGVLDEAVLGKRDIRFKLYGESVSTRHTPELLTAPVQCLEAEPLEGGGRWLPVAVLRPFAPAHLPDAECTSRMAELMRQVRVGRRGREARAHCCFWSCLTALWPLRVSLPHRINTSHSCARSFAARPQRRPKPSPARSARCPQASRQSPS